MKYLNLNHTVRRSITNSIQLYQEYIYFRYSSVYRLCAENIINGHIVKAMNSSKQILFIY